MKIPDYSKKKNKITYLKMQEEIQRLKDEYIILQNASDEVEEEKDREIERLTAESTKWESKFYDEAKKVDKAIEYIKEKEYVDYNPTLDGSEDDSYMKLPRSLSLYNEELDILLDILERK